MSRTPHEAIHVPDARIGDHPYPPQSAPTQTTQGDPNFIDGSGPIFSMYLEMAGEDDKKMVEGWKADADGILIFTGLFSAAVASLISVSIQDIRPNPQDTSNFYLANIYRTIADPDRSNITSSLPASPAPFSPPTYAVWVNSLWFLSLVISLSCALLATLLQQWARRYLKVTQPRYSPHKRARIRAFFAEGVDKFLLPWAVEALPTLLHVSLFLFFAGLVMFLFNVNLTIFKLVLSWVGVCTALYGCITLMPIFCHDSPYYTPLTSSVWPIIIGILYVLSQVRWQFYSFVRNGRPVFQRVRDRYHELLLQGIQRTAEETALDSPSDIDTRAFMWTFDCLDEDHELERFFSSLPGFRRSKVVDDPLPNLPEEQKWRLFTGLMGLLDRTFSSDLLPEPVKNRRVIVCAKAVDPAHIPRAFSVLDRYMSGPLAAEIVKIVRGWGNNTGENAILVAQATVSGIVSRVQLRDDPWFILASNALGVPESVLRDYATNGDSLSLAVLIHVTRQQFRHFRKPSWPWDEYSNVLQAASRFVVQDTSPELQHDFCTLWNQIVLEAQSEADPKIAWYMLRPIRSIYIALHEGTGAAPTRFFASTSGQDHVLQLPLSYPLCNVPGHYPDSTLRIHNVSASTTMARVVLQDNASLILSSSPDAPSSSVPAQLCVDENLVDVPPLENQISVPESLHPSNQTNIESFCIPLTSPDPATAGTTQEADPSLGTIALTTPEILTSACPTGAVSPQHTQNLLTSSDAPDLQSSASFNRVAGANFPTGPPLSLDSIATRSGHSEISSLDNKFMADFCT